MLSNAIGLKVDNLIDGDMLHPGLCYGADGSSPEVGASHLDSASRVLVTTLEQFPVEDDLFTDIVSAVGRRLMKM